MRVSLGYRFQLGLPELFIGDLYMCVPRCNNFITRAEVPKSCEVAGGPQRPFFRLALPIQEDEHAASKITCNMLFLTVQA